MTSPITQPGRGPGIHAARFRQAPVRAGLSLLAAGLGGALALFLATHHPLSTTWATSAAVLLICLGAWTPQWWLLPVLALLPAIGLMPWSGWVTFEELDIALLAGGAGAYLHVGLRLMRRAPQVARSRVAGPSALGVCLALAYGAACVVATSRGFLQAQGDAWGWWQGLYEPLNSVRLGKCFVLALWLMPLLAAPSGQGVSGVGPRALALGLTGALACVSALVLWERQAFTGLANFSSDYRITALFWEMNLGGAALDGLLALAVPFAVRELMVARTIRQWVLLAPLLMAAGYACLATFSRGVYAATPIGVAALVALLALQQRRLGGQHLLADPRAWAWSVALWALFVWAAYRIFPGSGYRGLLGLLGAVTLLLPALELWRNLDGRARLVAAALSPAGAAIALAGAAGMAKGAYIVYAIAFGVCAALLAAAHVLHRGQPPRWVAIGLLASWPVVLVMLCAVADKWGGRSAFEAAVPAAVALGICAVVAVVWPGPGAWPRSWAWQAGNLTVMSIAAVLVGVLLGGAYMTGRMASAERDLNKRVAHWERAFSWMQGPWDWSLGKGTGSYPSQHALSGIAEEQVGDHRVRRDSEGDHLVISSGKHVLGFSEMYRVSQRIDAFTGDLRVTADVRAPQDVAVHFEACRKHLLYDDGACQVREIAVKGSPGRWQRVQFALAGQGLGHGHWHEHRFIAFSIAVATRGRIVEIDNLEAVDAMGRNVIANGDFERGLARWFYTSDRHHMPWHMKSMPLHLLFEQGWLGLTLFLGLAAGACGRLVLGRARDHPLAPALVAAILGFGVVGLFDSLLDAPRVAFVFYLVTLVAWVLPAPAAARPLPTPKGEPGYRA